MDNSKRDFNGAAKFFLGLSMVGIIITIITSAVNISNYQYFGWDTSVLVKEIIVNVLILGAGVLTFMKKPYGLIALIALFVLRVFATLPQGGNISVASLLGAQSAPFLRDFGPFAIAMFFKKNGISGWDSMLASEESVAEHTIVPDDSESAHLKGETHIETSTESTDVESIPNAVVSPHITEPGLDSKDVLSEIETTSQESDKSFRQKKNSSFSNWLRSLSIMARIGWSIFLCILLAIIIVSIIVGSKSYPDYIHTFGDKWKYTFDFPNDKLANDLLNELEKSQCKGQFFFETEDGVDIDASVFYSKVGYFLKLLNGSNAYLITDTVRKSSDIDSSSLYTARYSYGYKWASVKKGGGHGSYDYDKLIANDPNLVYIRLRPIDLVAYHQEEEKVVETVTSIPTRDYSLMQRMINHYINEENYNRAVDACEFYLKYNKNNLELLGLTSYVFYKNRDYEQACDYADQALSIDSKSLRPIEVKGYIAAERLDWEEARKWSRKAIDYGSDNADLYYIYSKSIDRQGETKEAQEYYNKAFNLNQFSPFAEKYKDCAGCPFEIISISVGSIRMDGSIITDYGDKLYSSKCQFLAPKIKFNMLRADYCTVYVKLFQNGRLQKGDDSPDGYTYESLVPSWSVGEHEERLGGWGSPYSGFWPVGTYRIEIWFENNKIGEESFRVY